MPLLVTAAPKPRKVPPKARHYRRLWAMRCDCGGRAERQVVVTLLNAKGDAYQDALVLCGACYVLMLEVESKP